MEIKKRDGRIVEFDLTKIESAVDRAFASVDYKDDEKRSAVIDRVKEALQEKTQWAVEDVQDLVEESLLQEDLIKVAKSYIKYRQQRSDIREANTALMSTIDSFFTENFNEDSSNKENANINASSSAGTFYRIGSEASKSYYSHHTLDKDIKDDFEKGYIYYHDRDYYGLSLNCMQHDLLKMFKKGFSTGNAFITEPQSISSAMALTCVILQSGQTDLFGGESVPAWDFYMEPYVEKSFKKAFKKYMQRMKVDSIALQEKYLKEYNFQEHTPVFENNDLYTAYSWAKADVEEEAYQAAQSMVFNLNSLASRAGGQVVFSSLNLGTCTRAGGRLATKALLKAVDEGIGRGVTSLFPIVIFKLKDGVSYSPGDPNYDLRLMSERVTAKRMFPNYSNLDAPYNLKYYKEGHPETEVAYMGCAQRDEQVTVSCFGHTYVTSIGDLFDDLAERTKTVKSQNSSVYINTRDLDVRVYDSDKKDWVQCKGVLRNPKTKDWYLIQFSDGRSVTVTGDHPFPVMREGEKVRIETRNLLKDDLVPAVWKQPLPSSADYSVTQAWLLGLLLCDGCYSNNVVISLGPDEKDILEKAEKYLRDLGLTTKVKEQKRGIKGHYFDLHVTGKQKWYRSFLKESFRGFKKVDRKIPSFVFSWKEEAKLAFLAGMIDADGYTSRIKKSSNYTAYRIQLGSINKALALQQLYLAQSLGYKAKMFRNKYNSNDPSKIRYHVEFGVDSKLLDMLQSKKKAFKEATGNEAKLSTPTHVSVVEVTKITDMEDFCYDVETFSDKFDLSGIVSHNCRTRVIANVNGPEIVTDRGNLSFTTLNLPRYAIEAMLEFPEDQEARIKCFFEKLDHYEDVAAKQLKHRYEIQSKRHVYNFPYVMQQGAYMGSEYLQPSDKIKKAIDNGTLSFGFVGLAECLRALTGHDHAEGKEYQDLGISIVKHIKDKCDALTDQTHLNWSLIATPAESVAGTLLRKDRKEFGVIEGVTDKEYYTNSFHVSVFKKVKASEKIRIEAPYHALTNAGHITYIEMEGDPSQNLDALHALINLMHDQGVGYFSFNAKMDTHTGCGYTGIINGDVCPNCGQRETEAFPIIRPRRVTGYLSYTTRFNHAKASEEKQRVTHV